MNLAYEAMVFAMEAHKGQKRKYTGNPYTDHIAEVAAIACTIDSDEVSIATAWLHDVHEDQLTDAQNLYDSFIKKFGGEIGILLADNVLLLSDMDIGNRKERKEKSRIRLSQCNGFIQNIKVADLISNTSSIVDHDPDFAKIYIEEKRLLLDVLTLADARLVEMARKQCEVKL